MLKATYPHNPIGSTALLARKLGVPLIRLQHCAVHADSLYRLAKPILKPDGSTRQPFDALQPLKDIHLAIKERILVKVAYPEYMTGSLKGRDAVRNADLHTKKAEVICEDIKKFFPSVSKHVVYDVWRHFFRFPPDVANLLTSLCTKEGGLPEGGIPSSYLANLVFWRHEPQVHADFLEQGVTYTRYVDDVTLSSERVMSPRQRTQAIATVYGMLAKVGLKPKRTKHEAFRNSERMIVTKLIVNAKTSLPPRKRSEIRSAVKRLELESDAAKHQGPLQNFNRVAGQIGQMARHHPKQAAALKVRLDVIRKAHLVAAPPSLDLISIDPTVPQDSGEPPWN